MKEKDEQSFKIILGNDNYYMSSIPFNISMLFDAFTFLDANGIHSDLFLIEREEIKK